MSTINASHHQSLLLKSDQRGSIVTEGYKCHSTFNFGNYNEESRTPFGALQFVNDVSVAPGNTVYFNRNEGIQDIILPVTGTLNYKNFYTHKDAISPEHILFLEPGSDHAYDIENTYDNDWINYLHIGLKLDTLPEQKQTMSHAFNFTETNTTASLKTDAVIRDTFGSVGVYKGRNKSSYTLKHPGNGIFTYVINGAFEVEERLMEQRDGLSLCNVSEINFESLSEHAILLLLEVPLNA